VLFAEQNDDQGLVM